MLSPQSPIKVLLLTQNIGSIECSTDEMTAENREMTLQWIKSVAAFVQDVDVLVLHVQEIGGKKFNRAFNDYLRSVISQCYPDAAWCSGLMGPARDDNTTFTALGSAFFLSERVVDKAKLFSFTKKEFIPVTNWNENERDTFYQGTKFSNVGTSRKGYSLSTLKFGEKTLNFVNAHLLHDADNSVAVSQPHPSEYSLKRAEALTEAMATISKHDEPLFLFGDFNLRLDTHRLKAMLEEKFKEEIQVMKKKIHASDKVWEYLEDNQNLLTLKELDQDAPFLRQTVHDATGLSLQELAIEFGPTYLLEDDPSKQTRNDKPCYKRRSRFLAWCDRVWFNEAGKALLHDEKYWTASFHPMDHLPVYLQFSLHLD